MTEQSLEESLEGFERFDVGEFVKGLAGHKANATGVVTPDGEFVELPGMIGIDDRGDLPQSAYTQAHNVLYNIAKIIMNKAGLSGANAQIEALKFITSITSFVVDLSKNEGDVYKACWDYELSTARAIVGVSELPRGALVQMVARAYIPNYIPKKHGDQHS